ncbi:iron-responsive transcriptional regulator RirA [Martelella sp. HB161492]|uniref:iron-responsive transcriptional regulator RirA n=1 Tax=Martelella sp. HB161492 TaxID=2720726 RepID=UPI00158FC481|nr:iron-responsive transcriptional regulator RirA [Martelella sp. HB161492]
MRLTKQTNYAVRMLMYCAANDGNLSRIPEIAKAYGVSELFLFKIIQPLHKAGIMETVRGRNGGVRLGRPAAEITLFDVVRVTEENFAMAECFDDSGDVDCPLVDSCGLNSALREALNAFFAVLEKYTVADLVRRRADIFKLLSIDETERKHAAKRSVETTDAESLVG